jgi:hypothetical protein
MLRQQACVAVSEKKLRIIYEFVERNIRSELLLQKFFCQIISYTLLESFLLTNALSVCKVKGEGCKSQLSLINVICNMFSPKYSKPPLDNIMVLNKNHHVNYIYSLSGSVYVVQISTLQLPKIKQVEIIHLFLNRDDVMHIIKILPVLFYSKNNDTIFVAHMNLYIYIVKIEMA